MKILYCVGAPRISLSADSTTPGPRSHILGFLKGAEQLGHSVETFIASEQLYAQRLAKTEEEELRVARWKLVLGDLVRVALASIGRRSLLRQMSQPPDLVYERYGSYQALGRQLRRRGVTWVVECNGLFFEEAVQERKAIGLPALARWQEGRTYLGADRIVAVSEEIKDRLVRGVGVAAEKIRVVHNGIDPNLYSPSGEAKRPCGEGAYVIGFVGQVVNWQGLDDLIHALTRLPGTFKVCIVGDGPAVKDLSRLAESLGVKERCVFVPRVPQAELVTYMRGFSVGYSGHRGLGGERTYHSPLKLYEYAAMGLPVVATHSDAVCEVSEVVPLATFTPGDRDALTQAIEHLAEQSGDATQRRGRHGDAAQAFSWEARVQAALEGLQEGTVSSRAFHSEGAA